MEILSFGQIITCWKQNQKIFWNDRVMAVWSHAIHRPSTQWPNFDPAYLNIVAAGVRSVFSRSSSYDDYGNQCGNWMATLIDCIVILLDLKESCQCTWACTSSEFQRYQNVINQGGRPVVVLLTTLTALWEKSLYRYTRTLCIYCAPFCSTAVGSLKLECHWGCINCFLFT